MSSIWLHNERVEGAEMAGLDTEGRIQNTAMLR